MQDQFQNTYARNLIIVPFVEDFFLDVITLVPYILGAFGLSNYFLLTILFKAIRVRLS